MNNAQRSELVRWFWRSCFSRRFSSGVLRSLKADIGQMKKLREDGSSELSDFACSVSREFFLDNGFQVAAVNTKTFILMLAQEAPLSFILGQPVSLKEVLRAYNRNEFHHVYPKAFLKGQNRTLKETNRLANFVFMNRQDNNTLGGVAPSQYMAKMDQGAIDKILERAACPRSVFSDDYDLFLAERSAMLETSALALIG
jgi:hypothetical protein